MSTRGKILGMALITLGLSLDLVAQEPAAQEERTAPAVAAITAEDNSPPADETRPDTRPVTGFLPLTVGSFGTERSFLVPSFQFSQSVDSNPGVVSGQNLGAANGQADVTATTTLSAHALMQQVWRQSQFTLNYTTGGTIYAGQSGLNSMFQAAQLLQSFQFRRWSLTLADNVTYTPESPFGFAGLAGFSTPILSSGPNQTILTGQVDQIANIAVAQATYTLNGRSSFTVAADFGLQRFTGGGLLDSNQGGVQVGYNYNLNPRDSLGISYGFNLVRYPGSLAQGALATTAPNLDSHNIQLVYGRRITGRLALRASGGPQINLTNVPTLGTITQVTWAAQTSLAYRFRTSQMELSYGHTVSAGAGVLTLSETDQFQGTFNTRLTRTLTGSLRTGYAHNTSAASAVSAQPVSNPAFDTEFVETRLARPLGHEATVFLTYTFQHQSSSVSQCGAGVCGDLNRHIGGVGFDWHTRPLLIR